MYTEYFRIQYNTILYKDIYISKLYRSEDLMAHRSGVFTVAEAGTNSVPPDLSISDLALQYSKRYQSCQKKKWIVR